MQYATALAGWLAILPPRESHFLRPSGHRPAGSHSRGPRAIAATQGSLRPVVWPAPHFI